MRSFLVMDESDAAGQVLESCRQGDSAAFARLFENYRARVYSIALVFFKGDASAASDITQQVFLKLMSRMSQFENRADFSTWLYRLVTNTCLDRHRSLRRWIFLGDLAEVEKPGFADRQLAGPPVSSVEDQYCRAELSRTVQSAIAALKPKFRIAILLKYFDDLSYDEMAAVLQVSKGTVASRLNRGHRMLARKLAHLQGGHHRPEV